MSNSMVLTLNLQVVKILITKMHSVNAEKTKEALLVLMSWVLQNDFPALFEVCTIIMIYKTCGNYRVA